MITESWGRAKHSETTIVSSINHSNVLVVGSKLSYGDSCLNTDGNLYLNKSNNCILEFNPIEGTIKAETGITFDALLKFLVPRGFFLPVTPGTKFITLGGAIANDIHGKNHHKDGNFGRWITSLTLNRMSSLVTCSPVENNELFKATIGGLGLTGYIQDCTFKLIKINSSSIDTETIKFSTVDDFFKINEESYNFRYTVAWIDCLSSKAANGNLNGLYIRGNHSSFGDLKIHKEPGFKRIPLNFPSWVLNKLTVKIFNFLYFNKQISKIKKATTHYDPFFYPLDAIKDWNKIYGKSGLFQFQCVIPMKNAKPTLIELLRLIGESGQGSFLCVLKTFGSVPSEGILSFPKEGITLALDFSNLGDKTLHLLHKLYETVEESDGKIYPAKDQILNRNQFEKMYPSYKDFIKYLDPKFSSDWWKRVRN
jgi:FAD/FMN-containing dehydrogenase